MTSGDFIIHSQHCMEGPIWKGNMLLVNLFLISIRSHNGVMDIFCGPWGLNFAIS
jgi:hypothetical protein